MELIGKWFYILTEGKILLLLLGVILIIIYIKVNNKKAKIVTLITLIILAIIYILTVAKTIKQVNTGDCFIECIKIQDAEQCANQCTK